MPNPFAIIDHARAKAELERLERKHRSELHRKLDAILERLPAHPDDQRPDCRTCAHVYTDMESYGCKRSVTIIVCG